MELGWSAQRTERSRDSPPFATLGPWSTQGVTFQSLFMEFKAMIHFAFPPLIFVVHIIIQNAEEGTARLSLYFPPPCVTTYLPINVYHVL